MTIAHSVVKPKRASARLVQPIQVDLEELIAAVRRHAPLWRDAVRAFRNDFTGLFDTSRVVVVSSAPTSKTDTAAAAHQLAN